MNTSTSGKRLYTSSLRTESASRTRDRILEASKTLFGADGIDKVKIADIAAKAGVSASAVYAIYKSKDGILRALMEQSLFGSKFQEAQKMLEGIDDPVKLVELTANVSRAIYESESVDLGLLRHSSGFSRALHRMEQEFEQMRFAMQGDRLRKLEAAGKLRQTLTLEAARRVMWTLTSRDVYRMLVQDGGWTADCYQKWLSITLRETLVQ